MNIDTRADHGHENGYGEGSGHCFGQAYDTGYGVGYGVGESNVFRDRFDTGPMFGSGSESGFGFDKDILER